jgi:hypothetical protein
MSEVNETWDVVLYYKRKVVCTPTKPKFEEIKNDNPNLKMDDLLDIYSDANQKYQEEISKCDIDDINNKETVLDFIFFTDDENLLKNIKNFERKNFFAEWNKDTKKRINDIIIKLSKKA